MLGVVAWAVREVSGVTLREVCVGRPDPILTAMALLLMVSRVHG